MKDPRLLPFIKFFESQGVKFVDAKSGRPLKEIVDETFGERLPTTESDDEADGGGD